jgi:hypothetical protein
LLLIAVSTLAACSQGRGATPTLDPHAPQALQGTMPAGGIYRFTPVPVSGTPEPEPVLVLDVTVVDGQTDRPVRVDVQVGDAPGRGQVVREDVSQFRLKLPGRTGEAFVHVTISADGYKQWGQGFRHNLDHSRLITLTARLETP